MRRSTRSPEEGASRLLSRVALIGVLAVAVYDTLAAMASQVLSVDYGLFFPGSLLVYAVIGVLCREHRVATAAATGAVVGLADASVGWAFSNAVRDRPLYDPDVVTVGVVFAVAGIAALTASVAARCSRPS